MDIFLAAVVVTECIADIIQPTGRGVNYLTPFPSRYPASPTFGLALGLSTMN